ncbi:UNVERIFIED_CONTAM: hypothetical protein K2H54_039481 [Gekko kuhli]
MLIELRAESKRVHKYLCNNEIPCLGIETVLYNNCKYSPVFCIKTFMFSVIFSDVCIQKIIPYMIPWMETIIQEQVDNFYFVGYTLLVYTKNQNSKPKTMQHLLLGQIKIT